MIANSVSGSRRVLKRCSGEVLAVDQRFSFPLRQRHALRYIQPGLALIGDAAHTIHPLAGQGANLGFADAPGISHGTPTMPILTACSPAI